MELYHRVDVIVCLLRAILDATRNYDASACHRSAKEICMSPRMISLHFVSLALPLFSLSPFLVVRLRKIMDSADLI